MPRTYKRALGSRKYKNYTEEQLQQAVEAVRNGGSVRKASLEFGPSRATITKLWNGGKVGKPYVLPDEEQEKLAQCLSVAGDWGFPLTTYDVRLVVKGFLDQSGRTIKIFKNNLSGRDFVLGFLKRYKHVLSQRMCQNIKRSRAMVDETILNEYFDELGTTLVLPPNSTGLTQPLDVSFFRPLKHHWQNTLEDWKNKNRGTIPKQRFPRLLKKCIDDIGEDNIAKNIQSGFSGAGIVPLDRKQVLKRLPESVGQQALISSQSDSSIEWVNTFKIYMKECRMKETQPLKKPSKKKLNVPAGRGVGAQSAKEIIDQSIIGPPKKKLNVAAGRGEKQKNKNKEKKKRNNDSSDSDESSLTLRDSDSDLILSSTSDDDFDDLVQNMTAPPVEQPKKTEVKMDDIPDEEDAFVIVELVFDKDTKKETKKLFYAKVQEKNIINDTISLKFLRKSGKSLGYVYVFPLVDDVMEMKRDKIVQLVTPTNVVRGRFTFPFDVK